MNKLTEKYLIKESIKGKVKAAAIGGAIGAVSSSMYYLIKLTNIKKKIDNSKNPAEKYKLMMQFLKTKKVAIKRIIGWTSAGAIGAAIGKSHIDRLKHDNADIKNYKKFVKDLKKSLKDQELKISETEIFLRSIDKDLRSKGINPADPKYANKFNSIMSKHKAQHDKYAQDSLKFAEKCNAPNSLISHLRKIARLN